MTGFNWQECVNAPSWLKDRTICLVRAGSHSYNTNIETSDEDWRGVAIAPAEYYLGIDKKFEQYELSGGNETPDLVVYEARKFIRLASQANPNILELLFADEADMVRIPGRWLPDGNTGYWTQVSLGNRLLSMRSLFVTKRARQTYAGYARAQLQKIRHNTEHSVPGSTRYERIQKFGYCTKNAMHLVRLLRMCREILETGQVNVKRKDAAELLSIRNGAWTLKELCEYAEQEDKDLDEVCRKSSLPEEPDMKEIDRRTVELMQGGLEWL
jgi:uncharacterized protein